MVILEFKSEEAGCQKKQMAGHQSRKVSSV